MIQPSGVGPSPPPPTHTHYCAHSVTAIVGPDGHFPVAACTTSAVPVCTSVALLPSSHVAGITALWHTRLNHASLCDTHSPYCVIAEGTHHPPTHTHTHTHCNSLKLGQAESIDEHRQALSFEITRYTLGRPQYRALYMRTYIVAAREAATPSYVCIGPRRVGSYH